MLSCLVRTAAAGLITTVLLRRALKHRLEENRNSYALHVLTANGRPPTPWGPNAQFKLRHLQRFIRQMEHSVALTENLLNIRRRRGSYKRDNGNLEQYLEAFSALQDQFELLRILEQEWRAAEITCSRESRQEFRTRMEDQALKRVKAFKRQHKAFASSASSLLNRNYATEHCPY